jgi:hypothetical protein
MNLTNIDVGDEVRITAGPYVGMEGVVEDRHPDCNVVRVGTREGAAYCFVGEAVRFAKPSKMIKPLLKK